MRKNAIGASLLAALFCLQACEPTASNTQTPLANPTVNTATRSPTPTTAATPTKTSPAPERSAPAGATARCRDGTYSYSQNHRGTCSHHGGVAQWLD